MMVIQLLIIIFPNYKATSLMHALHKNPVLYISGYTLTISRYGYTRYVENSALKSNNVKQTFRVYP